MRKVGLIGGLVAIGLLVSCSGDLADPALVSQNRVNGKDIAQLNASEYMRAHFPGQKVYVAGDIDSFVSRDYPQGDGYASFKIMDETTGKAIEHLQCRTWELTGCFKDADAGQKGTYVKNRCNKDVPTEIKKAR